MTDLTRPPQTHTEEPGTLPGRATGGLSARALGAVEPGGGKGFGARVPDAAQARADKPPVARPRKARPVVSVCIVNWNCRALLEACLRSLTSELQGLPLEVIVVDNASMDGAAEMVAHEFPHVVLVRNGENLGFARASNQAALLARGRCL